MTDRRKRISVFASATIELPEKYYTLAKEMGKTIADNGYDLVYGGSHRGLMYACAGTAKEYGSKIFAVMPEIFVKMGLDNPQDCQEFYITSGFRERKAKLDELCDAVIAIPGGFGTLEEISEMIVQKQLGYNLKPIVILNSYGFYDKLIEFIEHFTAESFADTEVLKAYYIAKTPQEAIEYINSYVPDKTLIKFAKN